MRAFYLGARDVRVETATGPGEPGPGGLAEQVIGPASISVANAPLAEGRAPGKMVVEVAA